MLHKIRIPIILIALIALAPLQAYITPYFYQVYANNVGQNNIPPRLQWNANSGYCGEVSFISAGLFYGQYISQYDARAIATPGGNQSDQLLLGVNDQHAAAQMHLNAATWNTASESNTNQFLTWVKQNSLSGYPVAIGIYTNEFLFYGNSNPTAGDSSYDHIVPVTGVTSSVSASRYSSNDIIYFSDNGLWGITNPPPYNFSYPFGSFQASRIQANAKTGPIYSLANDGSNYGIAFTGVMDLNGDTYPVRVDTNVNYENPFIKNGSNTRPPSMPLVLTITVSDLQPNVLYNLYRYNDLSKVPNSNFNANAGNAYQNFPIQISSGSSFVMTQGISSNEMAIYRAVKASAP
jgi:hypothetical protein